jgi:hypothetical protein
MPIYARNASATVSMTTMMALNAGRWCVTNATVVYFMKRYMISKKDNPRLKATLAGIATKILDSTSVAGVRNGCALRVSLKLCFMMEKAATCALIANTLLQKINKIICPFILFLHHQRAQV